MRIVGDEKDYYDCVQATGQDQTLIYVRKPEEVYLKRGKWEFPSFSRFGATPMWGSTCIIGFCGNIYPMIEFCVEGGTVKCFSSEEVDAFLRRTLKKKAWEGYSGKGRSRFWRCDQSNIVKFFEECKKLKSSFKRMFDEKQCPIFVAEQTNRSEKITYNALLRPREFFRIMDTHTAFQEIAMFMSNFAVPQKPMPVIPDEMKIHSRGYGKWSFRKEQELSDKETVAQSGQGLG